MLSSAKVRLLSRTLSPAGGLWQEFCSAAGVGEAMRIADWRSELVRLLGRLFSFFESTHLFLISRASLRIFFFNLLFSRNFKVRNFEPKTTRNLNFQTLKKKLFVFSRVFIQNVWIKAKKKKIRAKKKKNWKIDLPEIIRAIQKLFVNFKN